jgi:HEPN domain-containing protein
MKRQAETWLAAANDDLLVIEEIKDRDFLTHMVAFHAQQAVEKCFKAVLEENNERIPKIHNIIVLSEKIKAHINIQIDNDLIEKLNELYIESRYPADVGLLPDGKPSLGLADEFYKFAKKIYYDIKIVLT